MNNNLKLERKFFSVDEVASLLGCTPVTIRRWVISGTIASIKIGGRRLIAANIIDDLITQAQAKEKKAS